MPFSNSMPERPLPLICDGRFCVYHAPAGASRGCVLHVHAFGEEMNKSRRMVARTARALAADGWAVMQLDLAGCGDSPLDFAQADWAKWAADVDWGLQWLAARHGTEHCWLWGHRAGALLAADAAGRRPGTHLLFWQPVIQGRSVVQAMLRMKAAAQWSQVDGKTAMAQARASLQAGQPLDIAGYPLTQQLASALEVARLVPPQSPVSHRARLAWLEVTSAVDATTPSPAATSQCATWLAAGWQADVQVVVGPHFWQTVEIEDAPNLIDATVLALATSAVVRAATTL